MALDVRSSGIDGALLGRDGRWFAQAQRPIGPRPGPVEVMLGVADLAAELVRDRSAGLHVRAVGVVVPGTVAAETPIARFAANVGWREAPLAQLVSHRVDLPVALGYDVRSVALAEARLGAGQTDDSMFFVSLGAEVAAGYASLGRVDDGANGLAGEFGHLVVRPGGPTCGCGNRGCLEVFAAASRIGARYSRLIGSPVSARHVGELVRANDPIARQVWGAAVEALADALAIIVLVLDPGVIVIGGELSTAGDILLAPLRAELAQRLTFRSAPPVLPATLGGRAGLLGAALRAWDLLDGRNARRR